MLGLTRLEVSGIAENRSRDLLCHRKKISNPKRQGICDILLQGRGWSKEYTLRLMPTKPCAKRSLGRQMSSPSRSSHSKCSSLARPLDWLLHCLYSRVSEWPSIKLTAHQPLHSLGTFRMMERRLSYLSSILSHSISNQYHLPGGLLPR